MATKVYGESENDEQNTGKMIRKEKGWDKVNEMNTKLNFKDYYDSAGSRSRSTIGDL